MSITLPVCCWLLGFPCSYFLGKSEGLLGICQGWGLSDRFHRWCRNMLRFKALWSSMVFFLSRFTWHLVNVLVFRTCHWLLSCHLEEEKTICNFLASPSTFWLPKRIKLIPERAITTSGQGDISGPIFRHWYLLSFFLTPVDLPFPLIAKALTLPCWSRRHFRKVGSWKQPH